MSDNDEIRKNVSATYTAAVKSPVKSSCCGGPIFEADFANLAGLRSAGLVDVEVAGRLVYDAAQLATLVEADLVSGLGAPSCCGGAVAGELLERVAGEVVGKIWSAAIRARKPG
jgi:hypothetical protein